jgi:hypothetical protein
MIKLNTPYTIENGDTVTFTEGKKGTINGSYTDSTLTGSFDGDVLKATFHNKKVNAIGLMEITFHENGFDAKWKSGLEPGPMRGKWDGKLSTSLKNNEFKSSASELNINSNILTKEQQECIDNYVTSYDFLELTKEEWRTNRAFILEVLNNDGLILELLSEEFKKDKEIVIRAAINDISSLEFAVESLRNDVEVLQAIIENDNKFSYLLNDKLSEKQKLYLKEGTIIEDFDPESQDNSDDKMAWMNDKEFLMEAIKQDERILKYATDVLKGDREIVTIAVKQNISAIDYADEKMQCDPEILLAGIISSFENEDELSLKDEDIEIFNNEKEYYDPCSAIENLTLKIRYIVLMQKKKDFDFFLSKLNSFIISNHECYWLLQVVNQELSNIQNIIDNYTDFFGNEETNAFYEKISEIIDSFNFNLEFSPNEEFDTYFIDDEINFSWDDCKWADTPDGDGLNFTEFIMQRAGIEWDTETWSDKKYYNYGISSLLIGLQNYSLRHSREDLDEENTAIALYSVIDEKYDPIQESGSGHYGAFVFKVITEYLLGIKKNEYDLNNSENEDLEDFNGYQFDLKKVANDICNRDLFDDWPGASEFNN